MGIAPSPLGSVRNSMRGGTRSRTGLRLLWALLLALPAPAAIADPGQKPDGASNPPADAPVPQTLTAEWGGLRTRLRNAGVDLAASVGSEAAANVSGGARHLTRESGQIVWGATVDMDRLASVKGGTLQVTFTYRQGKDLGAAAGLGVLQQVQEVYGRGDVARITQFWYDQKFGGGAFDLKVGRLTQGEDFATFSCTFMNLSFCGAPVGNLAGDYWYNWPISQWGGRLRARTHDLYFMVGAYENNPKNLDKGFTVGHVSGATGVLVPIEAGLTPQRGARRIPGSYKIGGWYNSSNAPDVYLDVTHRSAAVTGLAPLDRSGRYGVYAEFQQQLTGTAKDGPQGRLTDRGLVAFLNVTQTDRRTTRTDNQIAGGLDLIGPFAKRPGDDIGFAVARTNVNARAVRDLTPGSERPSAEYAAELYYGLLVHGWLSLRPNVQYVVDPGGFRHATDVVVFGLKTGITL